jgi:hypothetical protein
MANALVLVVPGLLAQPLRALGSMRSLAMLAAYAGKPRVETGGLGKALLAALGIDAATPVAPLALLGAGGDPGDDYVLRADPVHLSADRDSGLRVQTIDDLSIADAAAIVRMLDRHFADDDLRFEAVRPDAWFARRREAVTIATTPPDAVAGRSVAESMPSGPESRIWRRWQNEIEMMLHEHAVNREREARGVPPVNAVWFSGGGRLADVPALPRTFVSAAPSRLGDLALGIARAAGSPASNDDVASIVSRAHEAGRDACAIGVASGDVDADELEKRALAPALELLDAGSLAAVHVVADGNGTSLRWTAHRARIWRRVALRLSRPTFAFPTASDA